jgi:ribonuclease E
LQILRVIQEESLKDSTSAVLVQVPVEVASFLLNEKRTEITKIELKQRINVLLVPNKSLDTPNYKLERLKHDDARLDNLDVSYKMADVPDDVTSFTRRSQERTNKQEPLIKGVLPDGPAPMAVPKPVAVPASAAPAPVVPAPMPAAAAAVPAEKGFFGWLKNLFGGNEVAAPAPTRAPAMVPTATTESRGTRTDDAQRDSRGGRGGRGGSDNRGGRDGGRNSRSEGRVEVRNAEGRGDSRNAEGRSDTREPRAEARSELRGEGRNDGRAEGRSIEARNGNGNGNGNGERRSDNRNEGRTDGRGEARGDGRSEGRNGSRRDGRQGIPADASAPSSSPVAESGDAGERQERGRRNDSRRRSGATESTDNSASQALLENGSAPLQALNNVGEDAQQAPSANDAPDREAGGEPRSPRERRGGRDRYGRDRRERAPRDDTAGSADAAATDSAPVQNPEESADAAPVRSSYFVRPAAEEHVETEVTNTPLAPPAPAAAVAPVTPAASVRMVKEPEPVQVAPVVPAAAPVAPVTASRPAPVPPAAAPVAPAAKGLPVVGAFVLPIEEMNQVAQASGLEWVNSNAEKVAQVQAAIAAEPRPIHVPREPKPVVVFDEGSLVLVETRKDLRTMTLPFETPPAN